VAHSAFKAIYGDVAMTEPMLDIFYRDLGRIERGDWWVIANPDRMEDYEAKFSAKTDHDPSVRFITPLLCFDIHEHASNLCERADPAAIQPVLHDDLRFYERRQ
jgi:hypothetical protein